MGVLFLFRYIVTLRFGISGIVKPRFENVIDLDQGSGALKV
jgi:hypothetical protein